MKTSSATITPSQVVEQYRKLGLPVPESLAPRSPVQRPAAAVEAEIREGTVTALSVTIVLRTVSEANTRRGAGAKMGRVKRQRDIVRTLLRRMPELPAMPVKVTIERVGRRLLDEDNLASSLKAVKDGVADAFGLPDHDERFEWARKQSACKRGYFVRIQIEPREATGAL